MMQSANKRARSRAGCLLAMVALWPALALGQGSPIGVGGNGIKVGEGRLHPTFDFETRLDSAAGYFPPPGNTTPNVVMDSLSSEALLHIRPGFVLELPGSSVSVDLTGYVDYVHYTGLLTPGSTAVSHIEGLGDLKVTLNRESPVSVEVGDHFERSDRTSSVAIGAGVLSLFNEARVAVPLRPGGGALEVTPQVSWGVELFKPLGALAPVGCSDARVCDPATVEAGSFDYSNLRASLQGRWRFLPKTAVVVDAQFNYRSYFQATTPDALLLHATAGVAGLVTPKIAVTAKAGWGKDFGVAQGSTLLAQLEGSYLLSQTASIKLGYARTLEPVAALRLFRDDRGYLEGQALLGGRLTVRGTTSVDFLRFEGTRKDTLFRLDVGPQYQFERWLIGGVGYLLASRASSDKEARGINYSRHEGYLRVTVTY